MVFIFILYLTSFKLQEHSQTIQLNASLNLTSFLINRPEASIYSEELGITCSYQHFQMDTADDSFACRIQQRTLLAAREYQVIWETETCTKY